MPIRPTPLVPIQLQSGDPTIWCKLEYLNPSGSTKDRIAAYILDKAQSEGRLRPGHTVVEASSGSTSIALALGCAQRGLRFIAVMPTGVSNERVLMIRALGGDVRFTPAGTGIHGAIEECERIAREVDGFLPRQFSNPDNARAHQDFTAQEILSQIPGGKVQAVVSGVGTGGTLVGLYNGLLPANPDLHAVMCRPVEITEAMEQECCSFGSQIPGVVEGVSKLYVPSQFARLLTIEIRQEQAIEAARQLIRRGFPVGPSAGLNYLASVEAARQLNSEFPVVTVLPDRMERYFTTVLFEPYR
jgi:cysteine synthase A